MTRPLLVPAFAVLLFTTAQARQTSRDEAERLLKAAQNTEVVDANPRAAIEQYQAIVDRFSKTARGTAATALLQMAECYRKLGEEEAQKIYQQSSPTTRISQLRLHRRAPVSPLCPVACRKVERFNTRVGGESPATSTAGFRGTAGGSSTRTTRAPQARRTSWDSSFAICPRARAGDSSSRCSRMQQVDYRAALSRDNQQAAYAWQVGGGRDRAPNRSGRRADVHGCWSTTTTSRGSPRTIGRRTGN